MKNPTILHRFAALLLVLALSALSFSARGALQVVIDADENRTTPVAHRYIHGVILDDAKFGVKAIGNDGSESLVTVYAYPPRAKAEYETVQ